jgi:hypothetical protein
MDPYLVIKIVVIKRVIYPEKVLGIRVRVRVDPSDVRV